MTDRQEKPKNNFGTTNSFFDNMGTDHINSFFNKPIPPNNSNSQTNSKPNASKIIFLFC
jgi:hypothetical protein